MIKHIYRDYFQKSFTFLYPLLGFKRKKHPKPAHTFMYWPGEDVSSCNLYCLYKKDDSETWKLFEEGHLINHERLERRENIDDDHVVYVFNLADFKNEFDHVINGKYSEFSREAKKRISDYYGVHTPEWVYIESFLFPSKYYAIYAEILGVEEEQLKQVAELCPKYNPDKETFDKASFLLMATHK
jgi:hypothetical protein